MESVDCNLCGSVRHRVVYEQPDSLFHPDRWFRVVECLDCGLGYVNPRPSSEEIADYYPPKFYETFSEDAAHEKRYSVQAALLPAISNDIQKPLLLDVGCASGSFPRYMKARGWDVEGVEPSTNAKTIEDFPIHRSTFDKLIMNSPTFDAITAWAVLEHTHDPSAYFRKAAALLKPGAPFIFLVTNFDSLSSRALFREDVPRHLYFFSKSTLTEFARKAGLVLEKLQPGHRIFQMLPGNILYYLAARHIHGKSLSWSDLPEPRLAYLNRTGFTENRHGLGIGFEATLRYAAAHPLATLDRIASLIYGRWQVQRGTYGTIVCTMRKPDTPPR